MGRILGQQGMQERRAAAGQPGDEQRATDNLSRDGRVAPPIRHQPEPVAQQPHRVLVHADTSDEAELGLGFIGPQQDPQGSTKRVIPEVVQAGLFTGPVQQGLFIQPHPGEPIFPKPAADCIDQAQEHRAIGAVRRQYRHGKHGCRRWFGSRLSEALPGWFCPHCTRVGTILQPERENFRENLGKCSGSGPGGRIGHPTGLWARTEAKT